MENMQDDELERAGTKEALVELVRRLRNKVGNLESQLNEVSPELSVLRRFDGRTVPCSDLDDDIDRQSHDPVCAMKIAHAKFLKDSPGAEKKPLQLMLLPVAVAAANAVASASAAAAAPAPSSLLALASALALPEDDGPTEDVCMSEESSGGTKRPRTTVSLSVAPAAPAASTAASASTAAAVPASASTAAAAPAPAPASAAAASASAAPAASPAGSFSTTAELLRMAKPSLYSVLETQSRDPRFAPFVHQDAYGVWGLKPQPLPEIILKLVLGILVAPLKATLTILGLALACNTCRVEKYLMPVLSISKEYRAAWTLYWDKIWIRLALFGLGFLSVSWIKLDHLDVRKQAGTETEAPVIVSIHMGWSDILVHMSRSWPAFVAKEGIDKVPIVGYISQRIGCIYAMRAIKETSKSAAVQLKDRIAAKAIDPTSSVRPMLVFPEGTTTNGRYLCKFKTGAFLAGAPVRPVAMHFLNQDYVSPSWESINIKRHIFIMMATLFHKVICYELPIYYPSDAEKQDPVLFAENVRQNMLSYCGNQGVPNLIPCDSTLENKLEYHKLSKATIAKHSGKFRKSIKKE
eukprot:gene18151-biopygen27100